MKISALLLLIRMKYWRNGWLRSYKQGLSWRRDGSIGVFSGRDQDASKFFSCTACPAARKYADFCPTKPLLIFSLPFAILCCPAFEAKVCLCGFPSEEPKGSSLNEEGSAAQIGRRSLCAAPQTTASRAGGNEKAFVLSIGRSEMTNH